MAKRVCTGCKAIYNPKATGARAGRCPTCARAHDKTRGSREQRGYGREHQAIRAQLVATLQAGQALACWRCGKPIASANDMHVGHDDHDRSITRGAEHKLCNLRAAGMNMRRSE